jgi:16S rRNA A1518/A1519 N6-dimethyltransferase RsmA/KsgA/DIM1 with predicted DNA glycosylase/AP lyase activity
MLVNALLQSGVFSPATAEDLREVLRRLGIDVRARGETLSPQQFLELARALEETPASLGAT